jgi:hypothetical protein
MDWQQLFTFVEEPKRFDSFKEMPDTWSGGRGGHTRILAFENEMKILGDIFSNGCTYTLEALKAKAGTNKTIKALDFLEVGESVDCRKNRIKYKSSSIKSRINKQFYISNGIIFENGEVVKRIA